MASGSIDYYRFLAARVPPPRLAAAAARRAVRTARNRLRPPLQPEPGPLLAALGCADAGALAARLARARPRPPPYGAAELRRALDRHLPAEAGRTLARADEAAAGWFRVYGRRVLAGPGGRVDWQRDFLHGGRFDGEAPSDALPPMPGLDPKAAWSLARGEAWVALACGAALEPGGERFPLALSASVAGFVAQNPVGRGVHWVSAMEAGLRAFALLQALWILDLRGPPDAALALAAARLLVGSGRFIRAHLEDDTAVPNNHLVCDLLGLLACAAALPEWPEAPRWRALALAGLRRAAAEQILPDGLSFEGSLPYHRFSLELFAAAAILAHAGGHGLGREYAARLHRMFRATRALLAGSGELPQLGDNDSGHALGVCPRGPTEGGYLLPLGAALFRDPALLRGPGPTGAEEVAWLLGPAALEFVARARPGPAPRSAAFLAGGFHALRRGRLEAFVSCGPSGQRGLGGHSHNDKLALELFLDGARALCDPGMPVYGRDPAQRDLFRSTAVHATVAVDGLEQSPIPPGRPFALPDRARARLLTLEQAGGADHLAGEHHGFAARAGVVHRRDLWLSERGGLVRDRLSGAGRHAVALRWPLSSPRARLRPTRPEEREALTALARLGPGVAAVDPSRAVEVPLPGGALLLAFSGPFAPSLVPARRSPGYAQLEDACAVVLSGNAGCPLELCTVLLPVLALPGPGRAGGAPPVIGIAG